MQLIKMFNYKKRSVKDMLKGKIDIIQDFAEHDRKYADGEITYQEWSEGFSKARHPIPCCIGGSAVGTLFGHNKHKTPRELQMQISFPHDPQYQEHFSDDTKAIFARGHSAEDYVARMGAYLLEKDLVEKGLAEKVEILPYTLQCRNMAFPNCIGDFDRAVKITGGLTKDCGLVNVRRPYITVLTEPVTGETTSPEQTFAPRTEFHQCILTRWTITWELIHSCVELSSLHHVVLEIVITSKS